MKKRMTGIKAKLKEIYESKKESLGLTQNKMAELLNMSQGNISHYMNPNSAQPINKEMIIKFASVLQVQATDIDPDFSNEFSSIITKAIQNSEYRADSIRLSLLNNKLAAGSGVINLEFPDTLRSIEFSIDEFMRLFQRKTSTNLTMAIIDGMSMYNPEYPESSLYHGDVVFIDTAIDEFKNDGIYAFVFEEQAKIKRLQSLSGYRLKIISDNPGFKDEILERDQVEQIHFIGKLVKKLPLQMIDL